MASTRAYAHSIVGCKTIQEAIEKLLPFRGVDPLRVGVRKTTFSKLIVQKGYFFFGIEYALRKDMYELHADTGVYVLPTFAGQGNCPQFDPEGDEVQVDKLTLVELVANTRVNQALNIYPTTMQLLNGLMSRDNRFSMTARENS